MYVGRDTLIGCTGIKYNTYDLYDCFSIDSILKALVMCITVENCSAS